MTTPTTSDDLLRRRALFLGGLALVYGGVLLARGGLGGPIAKDEVTYWPLIERFSALGWPTLTDLSDYRGLNTPLPFVLFGWVERATGGGPPLGRLVNLLLSFVVIAAVGMPTAGRRWTGPLCAAGLLLFPYYLGTSVLLYTDVIAAAFALAGVAAYRRGRHGGSAACFVLAIACRQFMVAFPAAILAWEIVRPDAGERSRAIPAQAAAVASLLFWIVLVGGLAPPQGWASLEEWNPGTTAVLARPRNALYFLTCVGAYFVVPEALLLRPGWHRRPTLLRDSLLALAVLVPLFALFPPLENPHGALPTMGLLDRAAHVVLGDRARMALFLALACLACVRFSWRSLGMALIVVNALPVAKSHLAWDKYALPLLVVLWYLSAREAVTAQLSPIPPAIALAS